MVMKLMAGNKNLPQNLLQKLNRQIQHKATHVQSKERDEKKNPRTTFTYYKPQISQIANLFKHTNIDIAFRNTNTLQYQEYHTTEHDSNRVYKITCDTCHRSHIGQSSCGLNYDFKNKHDTLNTMNLRQPTPYTS